MNINHQLEQLYAENFDNFLKKRLLLGKQISSYPLLLKIDEEKWKSADVKIMIFGQETRGWGKDENNNTIHSLMDTYYRFYYEITKNKARHRTFFQGFNRVKKLIEKTVEYQNRKIEIVWNNINKIGKYSGVGVRDVTRQLERETFNVISQEMEILKPDLVIFFTGPARDEDIKFNFKSMKERIEHKRTPPYGKRRKGGKYAFIDVNGVKAVRLYHPAGFGVCTNAYLEHAIKDWLK
ncbi:hypothetical protein [Wohlfahrtiimonas chitiniclastica]|uniref:hypothetical protein n=1 Tax=Wohlfahrtiimonas chitiniclastica TaxID=400946 RepID=UPI000B984926|nr:hypothetical protein [Wohlfahrtiimonas chitiniclastica]OYQ85617.1 hypothetical protein B9T14_03765 [Wohlfahrtiimonas chitiniclastica]OYQ86147.1 hypothetical protein B9T15_01265 [Wohlfahrtiimonas chitiniclastica]